MIVPRATYRLQLHAGFTMHHAAALVEYFARLGVSHVYLSPITRAAPGSMHGYDGVDPQRFDEERGGEAGFEALAQECTRLGLGIVLDIVPNHLDVSTPRNRWWQDVLRHGKQSAAASMFDVDWDASGDDVVVLPVLGEPVDSAIDAGRISIERLGEEPRVRYFEQSFPVSPSTPEAIVREAATSREALVQLLEQQRYRLCHWRESTQLNYRRFFDITSLAGVRVEDPQVFGAMHALVVGLVRSSRVDGLRVDHPDGLRDPRGYFLRLADETDGAWVVAEKILAADEPLREDWSVAGTTGYDFLNEVLRVMIDPTAEAALTTLYTERTGCNDSFEKVLAEAGCDVAGRVLEAELNRLVTLAGRAGAHDERLRHGRATLADAIAMLAACMPVYRTYVVPERDEVADADVAIIEQAVAEAMEQRPHVPRELFDVLAEMLSLRTRSTETDEFVARFQQFTAPVKAKGEEDTAFYRYNRFVALNEVGGDPGRFGSDVPAFHASMRERAARWPNSMLTTSTHDTKRSEDVRARLAVLSEMPDTWSNTVHDWSERTRALRDAAPVVIDGDTEFMLQQNLVGAWPIDAERMSAYMKKAAREAKRRTSWRDPQQDFEAALERFVHRLLADEAFTASVASFVDRVCTPGRIKSLAYTLLRCVCPGVPDLYQGCEVWDLSLVDPDNRRPVDFALRRKLLDQLETMSIADIWASLDDPDDPGVAKLWTIEQALDVRRTQRPAFTCGAGYEPLFVAGEKADRAIAFARTDTHGRPHVCAVVPCRTMAGDDWCDTTVALPPPVAGSQWRDRLTHERFEPSAVRLRDLLAIAPLALLVGDAA